MGTRGQHIGHRWGRRRQMLEVVKEQEHPPGIEISVQALAQWLGAALADAECLCDGYGDETVFADGGQVHKEGAVSKAIQHPCRRRQSQACLADASGTDQCEQANLRLPQQIAYGDELAVATDERSRRRWQIVRWAIARR